MEERGTAGPSYLPLKRPSGALVPAAAAIRCDHPSPGGMAGPHAQSLLTCAQAASHPANAGSAYLFRRSARCRRKAASAGEPARAIAVVYALAAASTFPIRHRRSARAA